MNDEQQIREKFNEICEKIKKYNPEANFDLINRAFECANNAHKNVLRVSGEPYIFHPLGVISVLCDLEMDEPSIAAGLLHDVVEDVESYTIERIKEEFGDEVSSLVDGLTKLTSQDFQTDIDTSIDPKGESYKKRNAFSKNAANMRKIFIAMSQDLRVMVIKLADRLHNMLTLDSLSEERQKKMARETIQIFAPIAHRLGIYTLKAQLEDLSFKYLYPDEFNDISNKLTHTREDRKFMLEMCVEQLQNVLKANNINAEIQARAKNLWSIRNKMIKEKVTFEEIYDLLALRVIVDEQPECYTALGVIHELWIPIPGMFSDYIAKPKSNGYKSLHTKVLALDGDPLEVQIRTHDMHATAEFGVAAHWQYKEKTRKGDVFERKLSWLRQRLFDWQKDAETSEQFFDSVVSDLFAEQVFIFTPRGDVIDMTAGSTPVDFAYRIHSNVGDHCVGAKVSGKMVPLNYKLKNGDIVEIISRTSATPSMDWLNFVKTTTAKNRIKGYFRKKFSDEYENIGRELVDKEIVRLGLERTKVLSSENIAKLVNGQTYNDEKDIFASIGFGSTSAMWFINRITKSSERKEKPVEINTRATTGKLDINFDGISNLLFTRGRCCEPLPGEEIVGYVTRGKGITLHAKNCSNLVDFQEKEPERLVEINWSPTQERFPTKIFIKALAKVGMLNNITNIIAKLNISLTDLVMKDTPDKLMNAEIVVNVENYEEFLLMLDKINALPDVLEVYRMASRSKESRITSIE